MSVQTHATASTQATSTQTNSGPAQGEGGRQGRKGSGRPGNRLTYAGQVIPHRPPWSRLLAFDILSNNLSIGIFLVGTVLALAAAAKFGVLATWAWPLALALLVVDLLLLISDLGDPVRFHHMLRTFNVRSPMSVGTWSLTLYGLCLAIPALYGVLSWPWLAGLRGLLPGGIWDGLQIVAYVLAGLALIGAVGGILYKGVLFSVTAQPRWGQARWFGAYLANQAILLGCVSLLALGVLFGQAELVAPLRWAAVVLLGIDLVLLLLVNWAIKLRWWVVAGLIVVGILLPGLLLASTVPWLWFAAAGLVLLAAAWVRWMFVGANRPSTDGLRQRNKLI